MAIIPGEQVSSISVLQDRLPDDVLLYIEGKYEQTEKNVDSINNKDAIEL